MSIFGSIMSKIFSAAEIAVGMSPTSTSAGASPSTAAPTASSPASPAPPSPAASTTAPASQPQTPVDVEAILTQMASHKGGGGNWRTSIVDLLKLLDLDSSLNARKELAQELNVHVGGDGSAEENIALHKAVMQKLAENGGQVPASMKG
jgi:3-oxoacyl-ACP reductase-like protein